MSSDSSLPPVDSLVPSTVDMCGPANPWSSNNAYVWVQDQSSTGLLGQLDSTSPLHTRSATFHRLGCRFYQPNLLLVSSLFPWGSVDSLTMQGPEEPQLSLARRSLNQASLASTNQHLSSHSHRWNAHHTGTRLCPRCKARECPFDEVQAGSSPSSRSLVFPTFCKPRESSRRCSLVLDAS